MTCLQTHGLEAKCSPEPGPITAGPAEQELRSCFKDHGVEVPGGDATALKRWPVEHGGEVAHRDALKACSLTPAPMGGSAAQCYEDGGTGTAKPALHAKQRATAESNGAAAHAVGDDF